MPPSKKPSAIVNRALRAHMNRTPSGAEAEIKKALSKIERNPRFPTKPDMIEAFKTVVLTLIKELPGQGYEDWMPPIDGKKGGPRWQEAVKEIHSYYDKHTAAGL